jgi:hypothetical protein
LASRYTRREELCGYRAELEAMGHEITARWLHGEHQLIDAELMTNGEHEAKRQQFALDDYADLMAADLCIAFTEPPRSNQSRGGRHVEMGIALGAELRVMVVGFRENVFCCLPAVEFHETWVSVREAIV